MTKLRVSVLICCAVVAMTLGVAPSLLQFFAEQSLIKVRKNGVKINVDGLYGFILGVGAQRLESWIPVGAPNQRSLPFQLIIDNPAARIKIPLLPPGLPVTDLSGSLYGGQFAARLTNILSPRSLSFSAASVDVSLHPQLRAFGIEEGKISLNVENHPVDLKWRNTANYSVSIEGLRFAPPTMVRSFIALNQIADGELKADALVSPGGEVTLSSAKFDSSLASGDLTGAGFISAQGDFRVKKGTIKVFLNRPDSAKLGNWLPLITNQRVVSDATSFVCSFQAASCSDRYDMKLGQDCLRSKCN